MRPRLLYRDRDATVGYQPDELTRDRFVDLELGALVRSMAHDDKTVETVATAILHQPLNDPAAIAYRQAAVRDALANPETVLELYQAPKRALDEVKKAYGWGLFTPAGVVHHSIEVLRIHLRHLRALRELARENAAKFQSQAFTDLFAALEQNVSDEWLEQVTSLLTELTFPRGVDAVATLGTANKATGISLTRPPLTRSSLLVRLGFRRPDHTFTLPDRDEAGYKALSELKDRTLDPVADALSQAAEHLTGFWNALRTEAAFFVGANNLHHALTSFDEPVALPTFHASPGVMCTGLYDAALVLLSRSPAVANSLDLSHAAVTVVTGANRGGKSTFLRSLGQATLLAHCGLFVPAESFSTALRTTIHTHFTREEDAQRTSGRLDEELSRMSAIVDAAQRGGLILLNESFASTNEREGSEIARNVIRALRDSGVSVAFVTHLYEYASRAHAEKRTDTAFLRAGREDDGHRDFRVRPGIPLPTSFGADLYEQVFGTTLDPDELQPTLPSQGAT
ncbi:MutS-related protein [Leifsonia virtsii]|uniref:DNA mismatch repair proteins mutS family domain-containing protein n=1 Tax=Leifsonia virtsii TaxID=3035915 RepID=A0ABT8IYZ8_9MICO|nr:hypothetical protein [Leifsonia virtsii]MDN4598038.1 hypothetical protein [Leifsonia virtsii]